MKIKSNYLFFWLSQSISELGSSMTSFALIIWAYEQTGSAMTVSLLTFFTYLPYILLSIVAGPVVDRCNKKAIILIADSVACICSFLVFMLYLTNNLSLLWIYCLNIVTGAMNAFQYPASTVAIGLMVPAKMYDKVSGLNSFSGSLVTVFTPMLASAVTSLFGLGGVLVVDMCSFAAAFFPLLIFIKIPEPVSIDDIDSEGGFLKGCREGLRFINKNKGLKYFISGMALVIFFSRLTYENILPAMILARSGGDRSVLGIVSGIIGLGGVVGGLIVSSVHLPDNKVRMICFSAGLSFLFGDLLMAFGRNAIVWSVAAVAASVPIPFFMAGQNVVLYKTVPASMQGRVFSARNALQYFTIPIGTLMGGVLADYVFEPLIKGGSCAAQILSIIVGLGNGSGMAVMFLCTGVCGFITCMLLYRNKEIRGLQQQIDDKQ